jgi:O-antigen ligase
MDVRPVEYSAPSAAPRAIRLVIALAFPFIAALTVVGTFLGKEIVIFAAWVALASVAALFLRPVVGLAAMTAVYMFSAYPTVLQTLGFLTINNLLGVCFALLLLAHVLDHRDFSFLKVPQVHVLAVVGVLLVVASVHSDSVFPLLDMARRSCVGGCAGGKIVDRTSDLAHDFVTRLTFLIFIFVFVRTRADIRVLFVTFMVALFLAVPSAMLNWEQGTLSKGFRATASVTAGSNPNRLAMICLMEIACWWFWAKMRAGRARRLLAVGAIGSAFFVLLLTGSRSGLLGTGVLAVLLQTGPKRFRVSSVQVGALVLVGAFAVATVVPTEVWDRATNFFPDPHTQGASSSIKRETTIETGTLMIRDHPIFGVGLGNFREVSRQIYKDRYFRPPHNSYLWAAAEGGLPTLFTYLFLFWLTWRDLQVAIRVATERDRELAVMAAALRVVFFLYCFFAGFADLWLNPITYVMIGLIVVMRRVALATAVPTAASAVARTPRRLPVYAFAR